MTGIRPEQRERGLRAAWAARRAAWRARQLGAATGWHRPGAADWRLDAITAGQFATQLEAAGWRAERVNLAQGIALVEVRDWKRRPHPLVAVLRTAEECAAFLAQGEGRR